MRKPTELNQLKRYVLMSDGEIEPTHYGEGRELKDLRPFTRLCDGKIIIIRSVATKGGVSDELGQVLATSDSKEELEKEKEKYYL